MRTFLPFAELDPVEQRGALEETWCNKCNAADLGIINPLRYMEEGLEFAAGECKVCGTECVTQILRTGRS